MENVDHPFPYFFDKEEIENSQRPLQRRYVAGSLVPTAHGIYRGTEQDQAAQAQPSLLNFSDATIEHVVRYPYLVNGASGTGKTVAALQLAETIKEQAGRRG